MKSNRNQSFVFDRKEGMANPRLISSTIRLDDELVIWMGEIESVVYFDVGLGFSKSLGSCVVPNVLVFRL